MKFTLLIMGMIAMRLSAGDRPSLLGAWVDEADTNNVVKFDTANFTELYNGRISFTSRYQRTSTSCDSIYLGNTKEKNLDFFRLGSGDCYEITGLSDTLLAYRHTTTGRLHILHRLGASSPPSKYDLYPGYTPGR